jgi:hypothetical protein
MQRLPNDGQGCLRLRLINYFNSINYNIQAQEGQASADNIFNPGRQSEPDHIFQPAIIKRHGLAKKS